MNNNWWKCDTAVNLTGHIAKITGLPCWSTYIYSQEYLVDSAIVFHRFSDSGGGTDEITFETASSERTRRIKNACEMLINR